MIRHSRNASESWSALPWKKFRRNLSRLQRRIYKAVLVGDYRKAKSLQKLILKSTSARLLAIRQVTQLNAGKKTPGIDGKAKLTFEERFELSDELKRHGSDWHHQADFSRYLFDGAIAYYTLSTKPYSLVIYCH
jgi:hypothetical protein